MRLCRGGGAVYLSPFEPDKKGIGWDQPFSVHPHLLECQVVEDVSRASVVDQDSVCVVISYPYANDECIIMQVVECRVSSSKNSMMGLLIHTIFGTKPICWTF